MKVRTYTYGILKTNTSYKIEMPSKNNCVVTLNKKKYTYISPTWMVLWLRDKCANNKSEFSFENNWFDNIKPEISGAEGRGKKGQNYTENYLNLENLKFTEKCLKIFRKMLEEFNKTNRKPRIYEFEKLVEEEFKDD